MSYKKLAGHTIKQIQVGTEQQKARFQDTITMEEFSTELNNTIKAALAQQRNAYNATVVAKSQARLDKVEGVLSALLELQREDILQPQIAQQRFTELKTNATLDAHIVQDAVRFNGKDSTVLNGAQAAFHAAHVAFAHGDQAGNVLRINAAIAEARKIAVTLQNQLEKCTVDGTKMEEIGKKVYQNIEKNGQIDYVDSIKDGLGNDAKGELDTHNVRGAITLAIGDLILKTKKNVKNQDLKAPLDSVHGSAPQQAYRFLGKLRKYESDKKSFEEEEVSLYSMIPYLKALADEGDDSSDGGDAAAAALVSFCNQNATKHPIVSNVRILLKDRKDAKEEQKKKRESEENGKRKEEEENRLKENNENLFKKQQEFADAKEGEAKKSALTIAQDVRKRVDETESGLLKKKESLSGNTMIVGGVGIAAGGLIGTSIGASLITKMFTVPAKAAELAEISIKAGSIQPLATTSNVSLPGTTNIPAHINNDATATVDGTTITAKFTNDHATIDYNGQTLDLHHNSDLSFATSADGQTAGAIIHDGDGYSVVTHEAVAAHISPEIHAAIIVISVIAVLACAAYGAYMVKSGIDKKKAEEEHSNNMVNFGSQKSRLTQTISNEHATSSDLLQASSKMGQAESTAKESRIKVDNLSHPTPTQIMRKMLDEKKKIAAKFNGNKKEDTADKAADKKMPEPSK